MSDKGVIFSAPMVRTLLAGTKSQTRRLLRNPEYYGCPTGDCPHDKQAECDADMASLSAKEKGYAIGDRLYVREHWKAENHLDHIAPRDMSNHPELEGREIGSTICYLATAPAQSLADPVWGRHRQGRHMPRCVSRLWLEVTDVRVQRLQDICEDDAIAEGVESDIWDMAPAARDYSQADAWFIGWPMGSELPPDTSVYANIVHRESFKSLWNSLHTDPGETWADNPWIVAVSFDVHHGNIDAVGGRP